MNASRRESYDDPRRNERDYPHIVEIMIPPASKLTTFEEQSAWHQIHNDMHNWHRARFLQSRSGFRRTEEQNREFVCFIRFCFKEARDAEDFRIAFGGCLAAPRYKPRDVFRA
jgi:hypothetical protein